jgi:hypothetical protein
LRKLLPRGWGSLKRKGQGHRAWGMEHGVRSDKEDAMRVTLCCNGQLTTDHGQLELD